MLFRSARQPPARRFSILRVLLALITLSIGLATQLAPDQVEQVTGPLRREPVAPSAEAWFAPYVDVTLTPHHPFEDGRNTAGDTVLSFIVSDPEDPCIPSWGSFFTLDDAANRLDLDRRVARMRETGRDVVVSFGGLVNDEPAVGCTDHDRLVGTYRTVIDRYDLTTIDLDIEGSGIGSDEVNRRRAEAVAELQASIRDDGGQLAVWLTLPAASFGLTAEGVAVIDAMLEAGVDLAGVNFMTMNFGGSLVDDDMALSVTEGLTAGHQQILRAYRRAGTPITDEQAWRKVGATPMLGRNDIVSEVFTLSDAEELYRFVEENGVGRVSFWSLNRDQACGRLAEPLVQAANTCSHLDQPLLAFTGLFARLPGRSAAAAGVETDFDAFTVIEDDPATSPYEIWRPDRAYEAATKVVWHGYVYQAKWWTEGDDPEAPVLQEWDSPWRLLGPVLAVDVETVTTVPRTGWREWRGDVDYDDGERVWWKGRVYEAKWWNSGFQPDRDVGNDWDSPWEQLEPEDL